MRIKITLKQDPGRVRELLKFASKGVNTNGVDVHVKNSQSLYCGCVYFPPIDPIARISKTAKYLVILRFDSRGPSPGNVATGATARLLAMWPDGIPLETWEDVVVLVAAHEFRHVWQHQRAERKGLKGTGGKGEHDADKWALKRLSLWREATGREAVPSIKQPNPFKSTVAKAKKE